jgi:glycosyltransferase involved in cell wall biosynthesis
MSDLLSDFKLISKIAYNSITPKVSIVIPFFNRQKDLKKNLDQLMSVLTIPFELILINDSSEDETLEELLEWQQAQSSSSHVLVDISLYGSSMQQFETRCDAFGILQSRSNLVLEIQADMYIVEKGFDQRLVDSISSSNDFIAISGRGCHTFEEVYDSFQSSMGAATFDNMSFLGFLSNRFLAFMRLLVRGQEGVKNQFLAEASDQFEFTELDNLPFPSLEIFQLSGKAGKLGQLINSDLKTPDSLSRLIWIGETVMRGPLLIEKNKYLELGGFNIESFFLGYDEHDLFLRASLVGYRCGYVPIDFLSPLKSGTSRARRSWKTEYALTKNLFRIWKNRNTCAITVSYYEKPSSVPQIRNF